MQDTLAELNITLAGTSKIFGTMLLPTFEMFKMATDEMAKKDPKVIIANTNFAGWMACSFYNSGLYGPDLVFIWHVASYFWPQTGLRLPGCTDEMIGEIFKSSIFFTAAHPLGMELNIKDILGITPQQFDDELIARVEEPHYTDIWACAIAKLF